MRRRMSLRTRITLAAALATAVPLLSVSLLSYYSIREIYTNKIDDEIKESTERYRLEIESAIRDLNYISYQLSPSGIVGALVDQYELSDSVYERIALTEQIDNLVDLIARTSPDVGFRAYFDSVRQRFVFGNLEPYSADAFRDEPPLARLPLVTFFGPHATITRDSERLVVSALRRDDSVGGGHLSFYIESDISPLRTGQIERGQSALNFIVINSDNRIASSALPERYPVGTSLPIVGHDGRNAAGRFTEPRRLSPDFYYVQSLGESGWRVVTLVSARYYNRERALWTRLLIAAAVVSLGLCSVLVVATVRILHAPLRRFESELTAVMENRLDGPGYRDAIPEYDRLLQMVRRMKAQVQSLIGEAAQRERDRHSLEIEKLRGQINPHFLLNSLNSLRWMALMSEHNDMVRYITKLSRLLAYNLNASPRATTLRDEVQVVRDYLEIQKYRHDLTFEVACDMSDPIMRTPMPPFVLQPLAENAIKHAFVDVGGSITLRVFASQDGVCIEFADDGRGMSRESFEALAEIDQASRSLGIGLSYVNAALHEFFGPDTRIVATSEAGGGTIIKLSLPARMTEPQHG